MTLVRDKQSGILVAHAGSDYGAQHEVRRARGEIEIRDREVTNSGVLVARGAYVVAPGAVERLARDGLLCDPRDTAANRAAETRRRLMAAETFRVSAEIAQVRPRMVARYDSCMFSGAMAVIPDVMAHARSRLNRYVPVMGWCRFLTLLNAVVFECATTPREDRIIAEALRLLADHLDAKNPRGDTSGAGHSAEQRMQAA